MAHMHRLVLVAFATAVLTGAAGAEDVDGRYRLSSTPDGFLKLDSRSGAVSECKRGPDGYQCRLVPDEQSALQAEIDRLAQENAALRKQLATAGPLLPETPGQGLRPERPLPCPVRTRWIALSGTWSGSCAGS